jgi:oligopeptide transport system ATP-binding protein
MKPVLEVRDLHVSFDTSEGEVQAVRGVSFDLYEGETLAIVGESGSGKTVTVQSLLGLIPRPPGRIKKGSIRYQGRDVTDLPERELDKIRGAEIGFVFQDPMTSLNPTMTIGRQIGEVLVKHRKMSKEKASRNAVTLLRSVGIPNPSERIRQYPHQLSGGMRQRVMIAMALAGSPKVLIADEPTTALDVTIQAQILDLLKSLKEQMGMSMILITHDLGVVAEVADRVIVMYGGKMVESGDVQDVFERCRHPYTRGLLASMPRMDRLKGEELEPIPGSPPDLLSPPKGCPFVERCPYAMKICNEWMPDVTVRSDTHQLSCWLEHPMAPPVKDAVGGGISR